MSLFTGINVFTFIGQALGGMGNAFTLLQASPDPVYGDLDWTGTATAAPQKPSSTKDPESHKFKILLHQRNL